MTQARNGAEIVSMFHSLCEGMVTRRTPLAFRQVADVDTLQGLQGRTRGYHLGGYGTTEDLQLSLQLVIVDGSEPSYTRSVVYYILGYFVRESRVAHGSVGDGHWTIVLSLA
jgi:hypothetical protein